MSSNKSVACPFTLLVEPMARLLNCELVDDPIYGGPELQWFDDVQHGTGMLVLLSRRADRRVDVYAEKLTVDPSRFAIGAGLGSWTATGFEVGHLVVADDGVEAEVRFRDRDGRLIEARCARGPGPPGSQGCGFRSGASRESWDTCAFSLAWDARA